MNKNAFEKMKNLLRQVLSQPAKSLIKKAHILILQGGRSYYFVCERCFRRFFAFGVNPRPNVCSPDCDIIAVKPLRL